MRSESNLEAEIDCLSQGYDKDIGVVIGIRLERNHLDHQYARFHDFDVSRFTVLYWKC